MTGVPPLDPAARNKSSSDAARRPSVLLRLALALLTAGALSVVGTLQEADLARRDFTVNAMALRVTGADSYIIKVVVASIGHLESFLDRLSTHGTTITSIVLSSPVTQREPGTVTRPSRVTAAL